MTFLIFSLFIRHKFQDIVDIISISRIVTYKIKLIIY